MPVAFLPPSAPLASVNALDAPAAADAAGKTFADWFSGELSAVNDKLMGAEKNLQALAAGDAQNLHQVMISLEEAKLGFQLIAQVRSRLLESYQEVMRMQI